MSWRATRGMALRPRSCLTCLTRHRVRQSGARRVRKTDIVLVCLVFHRDERGHVLSHLSHVPSRVKQAVSGIR
jgi:hypothetical protein